MFDLTAESPASQQRPLRERSLGSRAMAILAHAAGMMVLIAIPVSRVVTVEPQLPPIQAFVATPDVFPEVMSALAAPAAPALRTKSHAAIEPAAAPIESPVEIRPEPPGPSTTDVNDGAPGGVEGGEPGGVIGGVAGGLGTVVPVARPPAQSPARPAPIRTSGAIKPPDLLRRVEPVYPALAAIAQIRGAVIVEAVVDVDGSIESVNVLQSPSPLLDKPAIDALKQWRYAPLVIAQLPTRFVVTVTFNFRVPGVRG